VRRRTGDVTAAAAAAAAVAAAAVARRFLSSAAFFFRFMAAVCCFVGRGLGLPAVLVAFLVDCRAMMRDFELGSWGRIVGRDQGS